jgi:hypothetical protein
MGNAWRTWYSQHTTRPYPSEYAPADCIMLSFVLRCYQFSCPGVRYLLAGHPTRLTDQPLNASWPSTISSNFYLHLRKPPHRKQRKGPYTLQTFLIISSSQGRQKAAEDARKSFESCPGQCPPSTSRGSISCLDCRKSRSPGADNSLPLPVQGPDLQDQPRPLGPTSRLPRGVF